MAAGRKLVVRRSWCWRFVCRLCIRYRCVCKPKRLYFGVLLFSYSLLFLVENSRSTDAVIEKYLFRVESLSRCFRALLFCNLSCSLDENSRSINTGDTKSICVGESRWARVLVPCCFVTFLVLLLRFRQVSIQWARDSFSVLLLFLFSWWEFEHVVMKWTLLFECYL